MKYITGYVCNVRKFGKFKGYEHFSRGCNWNSWNVIVSLFVKFFEYWINQLKNWAPAVTWSRSRGLDRNPPPHTQWGYLNNDHNRQLLFNVFSISQSQLHEWMNESTTLEITLCACMWFKGSSLTSNWETVKLITEVKRDIWDKKKKNPLRSLCGPRDRMLEIRWSNVCSESISDH